MVSMKVRLTRERGRCWTWSGLYLRLLPTSPDSVPHWDSRARVYLALSGLFLISSVTIHWGKVWKKNKKVDEIFHQGDGYESWHFLSRIFMTENNLKMNLNTTYFGEKNCLLKGVIENSIFSFFWNLPWLSDVHSMIMMITMLTVQIVSVTSFMFKKLFIFPPRTEASDSILWTTCDSYNIHVMKLCISLLKLEATAYQDDYNNTLNGHFLFRIALRILTCAICCILTFVCSS